MARQHSRSIIAKFQSAEDNIANAINSLENHIGGQIARVASLSMSAEGRLESFIVSIKDCHELRHIRTIVSESLKACKAEICKVNSGFLKFLQMNVDPEHPELPRLLGAKTRRESAAPLKQILKRNCFGKKLKGNW